MITDAVQLRSKPLGQLATCCRSKIGLLDHLGGGNLGDDATLDAVMDNIRTRWPNAEIYGFSMNPTDTQKRHNIPAYPIRYQTWSLNDKIASNRPGIVLKAKGMIAKSAVLASLVKIFVRVPRVLFREIMFLIKSFRAIRSFDYLVISGGGQLLDSWGGPWAFPYTLFKWILLARLTRVRCYFVNVGAGPVSYPLSKLFIKNALLLAEYVSFRDEDSRALAQQFGFKGVSHVFPDTVYSLDVNRSTQNLHWNGGSVEHLVGIAPMAYCDPRRYHRKDKHAYTRFIRTLSSLGSQLIKDDYRLAVFSTDINFDSDAVQDFWAEIMESGAITHAEQITRPLIAGIRELLSEMSRMEYIVTCRFHGVIFAHLLNKPVLAISHHPKVTALMKAVGMAEFCIDIDTLDSSLLLSSFRRLVDSRQSVTRQIAASVEIYKDMLDRQFDAILGPKRTVVTEAVPL
jgi:polysaccharide pyruvyl transferase WcaK-like protein